MQSGDLVGHYRIVEPLGQGGMGEVFVAEDTRLNRRVALKVLPPLLTTDPVARQRFEREAQAVAALNHPGIVTIHSVEEIDGRLFLTMELVDGKPLGDAIPRGGMALDRLLRIAIEVADAMAAAQQRGITHRDVKPANIMISASGRAKVLDFGLAKLHEAEAALATDDLTRMSTSSGLTGEGRIVGTVAYMSPEQAEGKPVDPRSDIFSLGIVLHEMATGERPFKGDTNVSVISSIIKDAAPPVTDSNPSLPADLARIIRRCLAKDPERRYQTAADLRNELEELKQDTATGTINVPRSAAKRRGLAGVALAAMAIAVTAVSAWFVLTNRPVGPRGSATFAIDQMNRLTSTGSASMAAMSPDGRYVVHVKGETGGLGLWIRQTATSSDVRIVAPAEVRFDGVSFTPDGNYVYYSYYSGAGGIASLYRVAALGGTPQKLVEDIDSPVTFSPDGRRFAFMRASMLRGTTEIIIADAEGANLRPLGIAPNTDKYQSEAMSWSPDGRTILATAASTRPKVPVVVYAVDAETGAATVVGQPWGFARELQWLPDGHSFLITGLDFSGLAQPQIWQVTYPAGERTRVTNDLNAYLGVSIAGNGRAFATVQTETIASLYVVEGPDAEPRRIPEGRGRSTDGTAGVTWTPDGRIVYSSTAAGIPQLWICDADGKNARQLTSMPRPASFPSSAPDGRWIYFTSFADDGVAVFRIGPDGSGLTQLTHDGDAAKAVVSPDGKTLYFTASKTGAPRLMQVSSEGGTPRQVSELYFRVQDISPDGARLLGTSWSEERRRGVMATFSLSDGTITLLPELPPGLLFMPDGGYAAVQRRQGKSSLIRLSGDGIPGRPMTPPHDEFILGGAISKDGRGVIVRGISVSDVIVIRAK